MAINKPTAQHVAQQLNRGTTQQKQIIGKLSDPIADTPIELTLDQLRTYEHNPRKSLNPLYQEIKESIRNRGLDQPPTVTKRPNETHYIIRSGGNTRLKVLKELYDETGDERFYRIKCLFKPWEGEIATLVGHMVENELHGELMFIDKAIALNDMRDFYDQKYPKASGKPLSLRELADYLKQDGYPISHTLIGKMLDCVDSLLPAIPNLLYEGLGKPRIDELLTLKNGLKKIWTKYIQDDEPLDPELSVDNEMFLGFWTVSLSKFNDIGTENFNFIRIKDEILQDLTFYTGQSYSTLELDLLDNARSNKSTAPITNANEHEISSPSPASILSPVDTKQTQPLTTTNTDSQATTKQSPIEAKTVVTPLETVNNTSPLPVINDLSKIDEAQHIEEHIIEAVTTSPKVQKINQEIDKQLGGDPIVFEEATLKAIPVQAGGGLSEVTDIWYIPKQLDTIDSLRNELYQLAYDLANYGNYQDNLIQTNEGLGFGLKNSNVANKNQHTEAIVMLLMTLLRLYPDQKQADISLALFNQLLMGGHDINIGNNRPTDIGIERLPDVLLIKLFRFIRLARRLIDLMTVPESK